MMKNYKKTLRACYLGFITQAIAANFAPLLFLTFHSDFNISLGQIALIPAVFYVTQLTVDLICAKYVDSIGYRKSVVASQLFAGLGLIGLAVLPNIMPPYIGILIGVFSYALGSGLVEVLCSPIVEACPFDHKEKVMSLLHSFYCWGSVGVILLSTLFFVIFGICPPGTARKCTQRRQVPGSNAFVPAAAGLVLAGEVVKDLTCFGGAV